MTDEQKPVEKLFSVKEKRYYLRLGITIVSLVLGLVILYYSISPLQTCISSNALHSGDRTNERKCHERHFW